MSSTEESQEYMKQIKNAQEEEMPTTSSDRNEKKSAMSSSERSRQCREQKRKAEEDALQTSSIRNLEIPAMSSTERSRKCRKRKKKAHLKSSEELEQDPREEHKLEMSSTERSRQCRKRKKKAEDNASQTSSIGNVEMTTKSSSERSRECRKRKKKAQQEFTEVQEQGLRKDQRPKTFRQIYINASKVFENNFLKNEFGYVCDVCDRLWYKQDLTKVAQSHIDVLKRDFDNESECLEDFEICSTCRQSLTKGEIPSLSKTNGYKYPEHPKNLPSLDPITERLISPRLPFMQIRRLRYEIGTYKIIGQVINVPVEVDNMVKQLPRQLDDDYSFNVSIKKYIIHKTSYLSGLVKKRVVKEWLRYMVTTPLYKLNKIQYIERDMNNVDDGQRPSTSCSRDSEQDDNVIETIESDNDKELFLGQQHTMLWNESKYLDIAPGQNKKPLSIIFDSYAEELSFPAIYYGHPRVFKEGIRITPFKIATSEIRRKDRRGVTPQHILYMAAKIMRLRVTEGLYSTFKVNATAENITRRMIEDKTYLDECVEKNLAFLKSIPNSMQYWNSRKKDLFAMIRQLGKPTMFLTMSANEIRWPHLLKTLYRLSREGNGQELTDPMNELRALQRASLVNEDPVICCIYFNKIVEIIMRILSTKKSYNPFGKYRVIDFFKRIEFQNRGSPHAHILLWLENDPKEAISENMNETILLIRDLCSVSVTDLPETMKYYLDVIRVSIRRPTVFYKRNMNELWTNTFNPWIASVLNSNMDLQFIIDENSCAAYVVEYVNKSNRGVSYLQRQLVELQDENPELDFIGLMKKVCINMLNTVEMSCQEGAWYLLRQPMSEASREVIFIPTMWASERVKRHKKKKQMDMEQIPNDSTDVWTLNVIQKYEQRPTQIENVCLADYAAWYTMKNNREYEKRKQARILRYCNYEMTDKLTEYKREMVTLFVPFRCEHIEITDRMKYLQLFDEKIETIKSKFGEYQKVDIEKHMEEYKRLCEDLQEEREEIDARQELILQSMATTSANNDDINSIEVGNLTAVVRMRNNVMTAEEFCKRMRRTNEEQRDFLLTLMNSLLTEDRTFQVFFTGVAGSGKTFTLNLAKELTNRFVQTQNIKTNGYVACASTGKAAVAIGGTTVHAAFKIAISRRTNPGLARETIQTYRNAFAGVRVVIIDEVSMIGAEILDKINSRMCDITGNFDDPFGGMNVIFCGDLRQLPPVNARAIYKPLRDSINGAYLWQSLQFYELTRVMRQNDLVFSTILNKIGNGEALTENETKLIESRFRTVEWCNKHVPGAIRLFHQNREVDKYNVESIDESYICECKDLIQGYSSDQELKSAKTKLYKLSVTECGGLPYMLKLSVGKPYIVNCNIDVEDGIVNGTVGKMKYLEYDEEDELILKRLWLDFNKKEIGAKLRCKSKSLVESRAGVLLKTWTPISKRHATINITSKIKCKRIQFPLSPASALTIHKSQGGTYNEIVFNYHKSQDQQLVYVALSRVTSIEGLFLTNEKNDYKFNHSNGTNSPKIIDLKNKMQRLRKYKLRTVCEEAKQFLLKANNSLICYNVQSLRAHREDLELENIVQNIDLLFLNETWLNEEEEINIEGFKRITQYKRKDVRAGGVCIYERNGANTKATSYVLKRNGDEYEKQLEDVDKYGDICAIEAIFGKKRCIMLGVYINPNTSMENIKKFICYKLHTYRINKDKKENLMENERNKDIPIILSGDFNLDIIKHENEKFIEFMTTELGMHLTSEKLSTTLGGSYIDMVFTRYMENLKCKRYISYFSYHKSIMIITEYNDKTVASNTTE